MPNRATPTLATTMLAMFSPAMRVEIVTEILSQGSVILDDTQNVSKYYVKTTPALGFLNPDRDLEDLACITRSLRLVLADVLLGQWDVEKYVLALTRAASIPPDEARRIIIDRVITKDASALSFARRLMTFIPDAQWTVYDDGIKAALGGILNLLDETVHDAVNSSRDILYELVLLGHETGKLATRAGFVRDERAYENQTVAKDKMLEMKDLASASLPFLMHALIGAMGMKLETGDVDDDFTDDLHDSLQEIGDLMAESAYVPLEEGSIGSFFKRVGRAAKKAVGVVSKVGAPLDLLVPGAGAAFSVANKLVGGDQNRRKLVAASARAQSMPRARLQAPPPGTKFQLSDVNRMLRSLQAAGISPT